MEENVEVTQSPKRGVIAVMHDLDLTLLKRHTGGRRRQAEWESSWTNNIRVFERLQEHFTKLKKLSVLGCITYGKSKRRVKGTYKALGMQSDEYLMHTGYIDPKTDPKAGKNIHIIKTLIAHYKTENPLHIKKVIVVEDSKDNVDKLKFYKEVTKRACYCEYDFLDVEIEAVLVQRPVLRFGTLEEESYTEKLFIDQLNHIEKKVMCFALQNTTPKIKVLSDQRFRLTASIGSASIDENTPQNTRAFLTSSM